MKEQEKIKTRCIEKEGKICTSIERDGSRTAIAKEKSAAKAKLKRENILKEKIADRQAHGAHEAHIYGIATSNRRRLEKMDKARERV